MAIMNTRERYGSVAQLLHWAVVVLLVVQYVLAETAEDLPQGLAKLAVITQHKSVGITVLGLAALRLLWRLASSPPPLPGTMSPVQRVIARVTHGALYALLFLVPLSGWLMSSSANYPVAWFGLVQLPDLVAPSESLHETLEEAHEFLAQSLFVLAVLHLAAALKHQFLDRDGLLWRMLPWRARH